MNYFYNQQIPAVTYSTKKEFVSLGDLVTIEFQKIIMGQATPTLKQDILVGSGFSPFLGMHQKIIGLSIGSEQLIYFTPDELRTKEDKKQLLKLEQIQPFTHKEIPLDQLLNTSGSITLEGKISVGTKGSVHNLPMQIIKIKQGIATIRITNPFSPFSGLKSIQVGSEGIFNGGKIRVEKIDGSYATVSNLELSQVLSGSNFKVKVISIY